MSEERRNKLEDPVNWKALIPLLGTILIVITMIVGGGISRADNAALRAESAAKAAVASIQKQVDDNKAAADAGNAEVRKDVQAIYNYLLTKQRQPRLESK